MSEPTSDAPETEEGASEEPAAPAARKDASAADLTRLLRIQVPVIAVLAQKYMKLGQVLDLSVGSIIQLDKPADDLLDLMVNDQRVGRGETVRIGENFGLQLHEIGSLHETIRKLGGPADTPGDEAPAEEAAETDPDTAKSDT